MRLIESQARMQRLGKIRMGERTGPKNRPSRLETFRFTSPSQPIIESVASVYGGRPEPWTDAPGGAQWQVTTTSEALKVIIPPGDQLDQSLELWSGGGCIRRCNGAANTLTGEVCGSPSTIGEGDRTRTIPGCPQDPQERKELATRGLACKESTKLNLIVPDVQGLGTWLLESHSYYALLELAGTYDFLRNAFGDQASIPARLRIDLREVRRQGQGVKRFPVPVLEIATTVTRLLEGRRPTAALEAPRATRALPAGDETYEVVVAPRTPAQVVYAEPPGFEDDDTHGGGAAATSVPPPPPLPDEPPLPVPDEAEYVEVDADGALPDDIAATLVSMAANGTDEPATTTQKRHVHSMLDGLGTETVMAVLTEAFDIATFGAITAAQADAVLRLGDAIGRDGLHASWREKAAAVSM